MIALAEIDITTGMLNDSILTTAATPFNYPTTTAHSAHHIFSTHANTWSLPGTSTNYVQSFPDDLSYMYNVQQPASPGASIISSSHGHFMNQQLSSPIEQSPSSLKATRSFSQDESITLFPTISPQSSGLSDASFMSHHASIGSPPVSESWHSDDGYVMIPTPSRGSSGSPVLVNMEMAKEMPSSPDTMSSASSSRRKKEPARKPAKTSTTKTKASSAYTELTFPVERANPPKVSKESRSRKAGGRTKGSHLDPETADHARLMRTMGNCWVCIFQREKVICYCSFLHDLD